MKKGIVVSVKIRFRHDGTGVALLTLDNGDVVTVTPKQIGQYVELSKSNTSMLVGSTIEYTPFAEGDSMFNGEKYKQATDGIVLMKSFDITLPSSVANFLYAVEKKCPVVCG